MLAGCISTLDNNFQVCSLDFRQQTMSECQSFVLDYGFDEEVDISNETIFFQAYVAADDSEVFSFNFVSSSVPSLKTRFFVMTGRGNYSLTLPVEDAAIFEILVMGSDSVNESMQWLAALESNGKLDMVTFKTTRFLVDHESLEQGLIREAVDDFDFDLGRLILYDVVRSQRQVKITDIDLTDMTKKEYTITNQSKILSKDFLKGYIFIVCQSAAGVTESYFISTDSGRMFLSDVNFHFAKSHIALLEFENRSYVWVFTYYDWHDDFQFFVAGLNSFGSLSFRFDFDFAGDLSDWREKNDLGQEYLKARISFSARGQSIATFNIHVVEDDFVYQKPPCKRLRLRPYEETTYPLTFSGNNLDFDKNDFSVFFFKELEYDLSLVHEALKDDHVVFIATRHNMNIFTMEGRLVVVNFNRKYSREKKRVEDFFVLPVNGLFNEKVFDIEGIQRIFFREIFLVVLIDRKRLFYCEFDKMNVRADAIDFLELDLPEGFSCSLKPGLVTCTTSRGAGRAKTYFFKFQIIDRTLSLVEIMTFLPDLGRSLYPSSFYRTLLTSNGFLNLSINSNRQVALVASNSKKVVGVYNLPFLAEADGPFTFFSPIIKNMQVYVLFREKVRVWVVKEKMRLSYPCAKYLVDFGSYVHTYLRIGYPVFIVVYRTLARSLRMLVYGLSSKSNSRLIKEQLLDPDHCPGEGISLTINYSVKTVYIYYACKPHRKFRVFKFSGLNGLNLRVESETSRYLVSPSSVPPLTVEVAPLEYSRKTSVKAHDIVVSEQDTLRDSFDLERDRSLELEGDIVWASMASSSSNLELVPRARKVYANFIEHENRFFSVSNVRLFKTHNADVGFVTNEYLIQGPDIQNNNFYEDCAKPKFLVLGADDLWYRRLFLCRSKESLEHVLTDFLKIRLTLKMSVFKINGVFMVKLHGFLYVFVKADDFFGIHFFKYKAISKKQGLLALIFENAIFFNEATTGFATTEFFHVVFEVKSNSLLFLRKPVGSGFFSISKMSLVDNFFEAKTVQFFKFKDVNDAPFYVRWVMGILVVL